MPIGDVSLEFGKAVTTIPIIKKKEMDFEISIRFVNFAIPWNHRLATTKQNKNSS